MLLDVKYFEHVVLKIGVISPSFVTPLPFAQLKDWLSYENYMYILG